MFTNTVELDTEVWLKDSNQVKKCNAKKIPDNRQKPRSCFFRESSSFRLLPFPSTTGVKRSTVHPSLYVAETQLGAFISFTKDDDREQKNTPSIRIIFAFIHSPAFSFELSFNTPILIPSLPEVNRLPQP